MKKCSRCQKVKTLDSFNNSKKGSFGKHNYCRECAKIYESKYWKVRSAKRKENLKVLYQTEKGRNKHKNRYLKYAYGITLDEYKEMLANQNNRCAICNVESVNQKLHVDHCHSSKKIRGLLCHNCNIGLGHLKDSKELLESAISYLKLYDQ